MHDEIRNLKRLIQIYRAEKNWPKVDELKHKLHIAIKSIKNRK